jgi:hypothetical protein
MRKFVCSHKNPCDKVVECIVSDGGGVSHRCEKNRRNGQARMTPMVMESVAKPAEPWMLDAESMDELAEAESQDWKASAYQPIP